ncbi:MAG: DUF2169 domain-containing protein, partial [Roseiarcus sp.]
MRRPVRSNSRRRLGARSRHRSSRSPLEPASARRSQAASLIRGHNRALTGIREAARALPFREQPPILLQDVFYGEPNASSLRRQSDLAPGRLATDVTFEAIARAPEGKLLPSWPVAVMIGGRAAAAFEVRGP